jgi:hypothetical protein
MSVVVSTVAPRAGGPTRPTVTTKQIRTQFKIDIKGKEVHTAETSSHSWIANQFGHVCLGILLASVLGLLLRVPFLWRLPFPWDYLGGALLATILVVWWEWKAYHEEVKSATEKSLLDRKLLRDNAVIAAAYLVLGVATAVLFRYFAFIDAEWLGIPIMWWGVAFFLGLVLIGVRLAVPWLRQKITWQKAALPYLFRLADAGYDCPGKLQRLINVDPPPDSAASQIVIGGPIGSGRTELCTGIGTEFAFKDVKVRYLTLATLLELAARSQKSFADDDGPQNIGYWPWSEAQIVIIDDIGPVLAASSPSGTDDVNQFRQVLEQLGNVRPVLARCHTVWAMGERPQAEQIAADDEALDQLAREIGGFCNSGEREVLVLQLKHRKAPEAPPYARIRAVRGIVPHESMTPGAGEHVPSAETWSREHPLAPAV